MIASAIFVVILLCAPLVDVNAQEPGAVDALSQGVAPVPPSQIFQNVILQIVASKISTAGLPEDLQIKATDVLSNAQAGLAVCDSLTLPPAAVWQQKRCAVFQLKTALLQLSAIEKEAAARMNTTEPAATLE